MDVENPILGSGSLAPNPHECINICCSRAGNPVDAFGFSARKAKGMFELFKGIRFCRHIAPPLLRRS